MAPKKKQQIEGQSSITRFYNASQGATLRETPGAGPSSSGVSDRAASAPARTQATSTAVNSVQGSPSRGQSAVGSRFKHLARAASANATQQLSASRAAAASSAADCSIAVSQDITSSGMIMSTMFSRQGSAKHASATAESSAVRPSLSATATQLSSKLQQAVNSVTAGRRDDSRYQWSRAARQAAGGSQLQQEEEDERKAKALQAAYLKVQCFSRLNHQQKAAAMSSTTAALLILAGAGTGKTRTLICRILFQLSEGMRPDQILAITFTNKAAGELKQRLQQAIDEAAASVQAQAVGVTAAAVPSQQQQQVSERNWKQLGVLACTFHSYCYRILRRKWRACGFSQCPVVWAEKDARQALRLAMMLAEVDKVCGFLASWLQCPEDWAAIQAAARQKHPQIISKWAEEVLEAKAKALAAAEKQKQAGERKQQAEDKKQEKKRKQAEAKAAKGHRQPQVAHANGQSTLEQLSARQVKLKKEDSTSDVGQAHIQQQQQGSKNVHVKHEQHDTEVKHEQHDTDHEIQPVHVGDMGPPRPVQQQQQQQVPGNPKPGHNEQSQKKGADGLLQQELQLEAKVRLFELLRAVYDEQQSSPNPGQLARKPNMTAVKKVQKKVDTFKCKNESLTEYPHLAPTLQHYQRLLTLCNAVDFNDLLRLTVRLFKEHPEILEQQIKQRPYLLVDEFQDCNQQQVDLVDLLQGRNKCVTVVGDDAQSIYRFRGAVPGVFEVFKKVYNHLGLLRQLEVNYRSTPQILAVGRAMLTDSGLHPKNLQPTVSGVGKPPVRLLVLDTEEQEAAFTAQKALKREGVPFVLVRDTSLFERAEVLDVMAYIRLALNQSDDAAFKRVLNVPKRLLGKKLEEQLDAAVLDALTGQQQPQQQEGGAAATSLFSVAEQLLREGKISNRHAKSLRRFLNTVRQLSWVVRGADPAEAVLAVLQQVTGLREDIARRHQNALKKADGEKVAEQAEGSEDEGNTDQQQQQGTAERDHGGSSHAAAGGAGGGFSSARQCVQEQECKSQSLGGNGGCRGGGGAGAAADDADDADDVDSDEDDEDDGGDGVLTTRADVPEEAKVTPAVAALYDEAAAFARSWALQHGVHPQQAAGSNSAGSAAAAGAQAAGAQAAGAAAADSNVGPLALFVMMSHQVTQSWTSQQLGSVVPDYLLEEAYAVCGRGVRVVSMFAAHLGLDPGGAQQGATQDQQDDSTPDALTISTIHAAKGLEYNTVFVARWVEGSLPAVQFKGADGEELSQTEVQEQRNEEQRLAHVSVTRAKERLYLTRPRFAWLPKLQESYKDLSQRQLDELRSRHPEKPASSFLGYLKGMTSDILRVEDLSTFP